MADRPAEDKLQRALDFALGLLSSDEEQALLAAADEDAELEALMQLQCAVYEQARSEGVPAAAPVAGRGARKRKRRSRVLLAGALLAATLAFFLFLQPRRESASYWLPVAEVMNSRRTVGGDPAALQMGLEFYADHDLPAAITALGRAQVQGALSDLRNLYLASALLNSGRVQEARQVLSRVDLATLPYPWRERGQELARRCDGDRGDRSTH